MSSEVTSPRVPWVALALSFLSAGVGHVYCGRIAKGLPLYFAWLLVPLSTTIAALSPPSTASLLLLVILPVVIVTMVYFYAAADAWRLCNHASPNYSLRDYNRVGVYWLLIVVQMIFSIGLVAGARGFVYEAFLVPTNSMSPTILSGDRILARKLLPQDHFPRRGDLIVFRNPTPTGATVFMKRVVAVAGDQIEIEGERILINGNELKRDRLPAASRKRLGQQVEGQVAHEENAGSRYLVSYSDASEDSKEQKVFEATVPENQVFVLGDNRNRSQDSRHFGSIHRGDIIGYVDYIFWPAESWARFGVVN
ncbi:MAG: signal peptidase I [Lacipirellulaceae bacterium]